MLVNASAATSAIKLLYGVPGVQEEGITRCSHIAFARGFTALSNAYLGCIQEENLIPVIADIHISTLVESFVLESFFFCFAMSFRSLISQVQKSARIRLNLPKLKDRSPEAMHLGSRDQLA